MPVGGMVDCGPYIRDHDVTRACTVFNSVVNNMSGGFLHKVVFGNDLMENSRLQILHDEQKNVGLMTNCMQMFLKHGNLMLHCM